MFLPKTHRARHGKSLPSLKAQLRWLRHEAIFTLAEHVIPNSRTVEVAR